MCTIAQLHNVHFTVHVVHVLTDWPKNKSKIRICVIKTLPEQNKQNIQSLHSEQSCVFIPPYLEQHFCLLETDDSLTRILLQAINHVLEGDH